MSYLSYIQLLKQAGLSLGPVSFAMFGHAGTGVVADRDIQVGEILGIVPRALCTFPCPCYKNSLTEFERLVVQVSRKKESGFAEDFMQPLTISKYSEHQIKGLRDQQLWEAYSSFVNQKAQTVKKLAETTKLNESHLFWAFDFCVTRCYKFAGTTMIIPFADLFNSDDFACYETTLQLTDHLSPVTLLSLQGEEEDLTQYNQRYNKSIRKEKLQEALSRRDFSVLDDCFEDDCEQQQQEQKEIQTACFSAVLVVASCSILQGQQIYMTYGHCDNTSLLTRYGYALIDNRYQTIPLSYRPHSLYQTRHSQPHFILTLRLFCRQLWRLSDAIWLLEQLLGRMERTSQDEQLQKYCCTRTNIIKRQIDYLKFLAEGRPSYMEMYEGCRKVLHA